MLPKNKRPKRSSCARENPSTSSISLHPEEESTPAPVDQRPIPDSTPDSLPKKKGGNRLVKDSLEIHTTEGRWYNNWDFRDTTATKTQVARSMKQLGNNISGLTRALGVANSTLIAKEVLVSELKEHISQQQNSIIRLNAEMKMNHPAKDLQDKVDMLEKKLKDKDERHSLELKTKHDQNERTCNYLSGRIDEEKANAENWKEGYYKYKNRSLNADTELEVVRSKFEKLNTTKQSQFEAINSLEDQLKEKDDSIRELQRRNQLLEKTVKAKNSKIEFLFDEQYKYKSRLNKVYDREAKLDRKRYGKKKDRVHEEDSAVYEADRSNNN